MAGLKYALRALRQTPLVTAVAVLSLALGIGANAAIFSLFDQMLLRPLPVRDPGRLVNLSAPGPKPGGVACGAAGGCDDVFSYPMFRDLARASTAPQLRAVLGGLAAHRDFGANLAFRGETRSGTGMLVSGSYFPTLGLTAAAGRLLGPADDVTPGAHALAVLSYDYWSTRLGRDAGVVGEMMVVNGQSMTIVGVAPRGFAGTTLGTPPDVFVPLAMRESVSPGWNVVENRRAYWLYVFGRLAPGATTEQAARALTAVYRPILAEVEAPLQKGMSAATMARFRVKEIVVTPGPQGQSERPGETRTPLVLLLAITGIVLLIACANIANLLLARGARRAGEMAVRLSLGAGRGHLVRQLLTESLLLGAAGGLLGLGVAGWTLRGVTALLPADDARQLHTRLDPTVVAFAAVVALGTAVLFGLFPALHSTRPALIGTIRSSAGQLSVARAAARFRTSLVTAQIALAMTLLVCAGLFLRSLVNVSRIDLGLVTERVVTFGIAPQLNGYANARSAALFERLEQELAALPGVAAASAARVPLLANQSWGTSVAVEGFRPDPEADVDGRYNQVGVEYLRTLGIGLLAGRAFTAADNLGAPKVAIVNETFARKFGLGRHAVGRHMALGNGAGARGLDIEIVGLARDAKYADVKDETPPMFLMPYRQDSTIGVMNYYVRTTLPAEQILRAIPRVVKALDPNLPVENLKTLPQQVRERTFLDRLVSVLAVAFASLATLLAAIGLYGVLAYTIAQRTREIGVRMALGASRAQVRGMVLRQVTRMTLAGALIGIVAALGLGTGAKSILFGISGWDPLSIGLAAVLLGVVAYGAGYLPARRASTVEPIRALRYE
jgi:predicted permease